MYLWTQQDHFGHTRVEAFYFGLWYICRENDELMVFSVLCYRRITHVRRGRRKGGGREGSVAVCQRPNGYIERARGKSGGDVVWRLPFGCCPGGKAGK